MTTATHHCKGGDDLAAALALYSENCLFRGQTAHFTGPNGEPSLAPSLPRTGCVPPVMRKWTFYAHELLCRFAGSHIPFDPDATQALLQHYGWRSFYLDVSPNIAIAAWFASNAYSEQPRLDLSEDCAEQPVYLHRRSATYLERDPEDIGNIYVFDRGKLDSLGVGVVDLTRSAPVPPGTRTRFQAQDAWLLGPISERLPLEAIAAHITAPVAALKTLQAGLGGSVRQMFPDRQTDPILDALLSLPWIALDPGDESEKPSPSFSRGLELPEYDYTYQKRLPSEHAFPSPFLIANDRSSFSECTLNTARFYIAPDIAAFRTDAGQDSTSIPLTARLLQDHPTLVVETEGLLRHPEIHLGAEYGKGVVVRSHQDEGAVEVSELFVEHPGCSPTGFGETHGLSYSVDTSGSLHRQPRDGDCHCGNPLRHERHLALLLSLEECLRENRLTIVSSGVFRMR